MDLSVIIVSYKGWERLLKCLGTLSSITGDKFSCEVIVVDNSSDITFNEIEKKYPAFIYIHNPVNGGFANGCNLGARHATGDYLLFLNPDTVATESEIRKLLFAARQNPDYHILSCRQIDEKGREGHPFGQFYTIRNLTGFQRTLAGIFRPEKAESTDKEVIFPDWVSGSVIMISRERFQKIGGFDEDFWMYYEDVDLCHRIHDTGGKVALFRNITIEHNHGGSSRVNVRTSSITKTEVHISEHVYLGKHLNGIEKLFVQLIVLINNLVTGIVLALSGTVFFFIPKLYVKTLVFIRLMNYYFGALYRLTWVGSQALNLRKSRLKE